MNQEFNQNIFFLIYLFWEREEESSFVFLQYCMYDELSNKYIYIILEYYKL